MIKANELFKLFGDYAAVNNAAFTVPNGSVYGLVGPNGAGKTTLLRLISGIYESDLGEILIDDMPVYENPAVKKKIAFISDELYFFTQANVLDMKRLYQDMYPTFDEDRFRRLSQVFNLPMKRPIRTFSKGQKKQVAFWLALSCMPQYLLLDEPIDGLDPVMRRQVLGMVMNDVDQRGMSVMISSHNLRELEDICDHVGIMNKGEIILERSLSDLQDNIVKVQVALPDGYNNFSEQFGAMHISKMGRVYTLILPVNEAKAREMLAPYNPILIDILPLTLEEIFIYEMGDVNYGIKEIFA